ncbi:hypothetical protein CR152_15590 [Massilia violaceinigra]|uniref:Uncharacterized protein n=1 Tax=Massilia violaceinigra TaxID=2045208 RepID=A0A2D2DLF6_9BURK|nr:hypothetical protein [Massilia violaceinigra]ATQ75790.1 hypothetical protein CR152_15590 [Massilia violaceinigra]
MTDLDSVAKSSDDTFVAGDQSAALLRGMPDTLPKHGGVPAARSMRNLAGMDGLGMPIPAGRSGMLGLANADTATAPTSQRRVGETRVGEVRIRIAEASGNRTGTSPEGAAKSRKSSRGANWKKNEVKG